MGNSVIRHVSHEILRIWFFGFQCASPEAIARHSRTLSQYIEKLEDWDANYEWWEQYLSETAKQFMKYQLDFSLPSPCNNAVQTFAFAL